MITHGTNARQVRTLAEEVEQRITAAGGPKPLRIEGLDDLTWVLLDYGDFVVHVFSEEARRFYELERLWADVPRVDWRDCGRARSGRRPLGLRAAAGARGAWRRPRPGPVRRRPTCPSPRRPSDRRRRTAAGRGGRRAPLGR